MTYPFSTPPSEPPRHPYTSDTAARNVGKGCTIAAVLMLVSALSVVGLGAVLLIGLCG